MARGNKNRKRSRSRSAESAGNEGDRHKRKSKNQYEGSNNIDRSNEEKRDIPNEIKTIVNNEARKQFDNLDEDEQLEKVFGIKDFDTTKVGYVY
jgi:hypothetical protein